MHAAACAVISNFITAYSPWESLSPVCLCVCVCLSVCVCVLMCAGLSLFSAEYYCCSSQSHVEFIIQRWNKARCV